MKANDFSNFTFYTEINGIETTMAGEAEVSPYHPETMYRRNGDPGDPAEGGELEDIHDFRAVQYDDDGNEIDITDSVDPWDYADRIMDSRE